MARSKKEQSMIFTALGVLMTIWQDLVAAVRENEGSDADIYRLATPAGRPLIKEMGRLIAAGGKVVTAPKVEMVIIAGYSFLQITYPDGSREIELGEFEVDYDEPLPSKLAGAWFSAECDGEYPDTYNTDITAERFPYQETGKRKIRLSLIHTGHDVQKEENFKALTDKLERRDGDHAQGLAVAKRFPNLQRELYILMFGSSWRGPAGDTIFLIFGRNCHVRVFGYTHYGSGWSGPDWALVARNGNDTPVTAPKPEESRWAELHDAMGIPDKHIWSEFTEEHFPLGSKPAYEYDLEVVQFDRYLSDRALLAEIKERGFELPEPEDGMTYAAAHPEQKEHSIVVRLACPWVDGRGDADVFFLCSNEYERFLHGRCIYDGWSEHDRFLLRRPRK